MLSENTPQTTGGDDVMPIIQRISAFNAGFRDLYIFKIGPETPKLTRMWLIIPGNYDCVVAFSCLTLYYPPHPKMP